MSTTVGTTRQEYAVLYTPGGPIRSTDRRHSPAILRLARDTWASRDMILRLIRRDVQSRYREFYMGPAWMVLSPAITITVFLVLTKTGVLNAGAVPVPYPLFALAGISIWGFFVGGVAAGTSSLTSAGSLLTKVNVSKAALVVASLGAAFVDFGVRIAFIAVLYAFYLMHPPAMALLALPALVPLVLLTIALAMIQSILGVVARDIAALVPTVMGLMVFLLPIYYETPKNALFAQLNNWNPLYHLVCGPRDLLLRGQLASPSGFVASTLVAVVLLAFAGRLFFRAQYKIAERA
jgi:lipopolysaccharide transport system permease protein